MNNHLITNKIFFASVVLTISLFLILFNINGFLAYKGMNTLDKVAMSVFAGKPRDIIEIKDSALNQQSGTSSVQYVILSFDGSRSLDMWRDTVNFALEMKNAGHPVHFTYFINPIYLLTKEKARADYYPPKSFPGNSKIGYATSDDDIKRRVDAINNAYVNGHEIGSHAVGHFNGRSWSEEDWQKEFSQFSSIVDNAKLSFNSSSIKGFRAPELGINSSLYKVLAKNKFDYDSSDTALMGSFPKKDNNGIWHIGIGVVKIDKERTDENGIKNKGKYKGGHTLAMDYNFWIVQSSGKDVVKSGDVLWTDFFNEVKSSYIDYFNKSYNGNRAPVVIGHHFSKWNDGVYWEALKSFTKEICVKPDVKCVTFGEYVKYLNSL